MSSGDRVGKLCRAITLENLLCVFTLYVSLELVFEPPCHPCGVEHACSGCLFSHEQAFMSRHQQHKQNLA